MVSDNQLDQYLKFVKHAIGISLDEPLIHSAHCQSQHAYHFRVWTKECRQHDNSIHCWFVLSETSKMSLADVFLVTPKLVTKYVYINVIIMTYMYIGIS